MEMREHTGSEVTNVGVNIQEKSTVIWNVANHLFGYFKPHEYGLVILPMTVVKRFHDCLLPTHQAVLATNEKVKKLAVIDGFLRNASGFILTGAKEKLPRLVAHYSKEIVISFEKVLVLVAK